MKNELNDLLEVQDAELDNPKVFVRLVTSAYKTKRGIHLAKNIIFLRRQCVGFNFVEEDVAMVGR